MPSGHDITTSHVIHNMRSATAPLVLGQAYNADISAFESSGAEEPETEDEDSDPPDVRRTRQGDRTMRGRPWGTQFYPSQPF